MPVTLHETWDSRDTNVSTQGGGVVRRWIGIGSVEEDEVYDATLTGSPDYYDGFIRSDIKLTPLGGPNWKVEVTYAPRGAGGGDQPVGDTGSGGIGGEPASQPTAPSETDLLGAGWSIETSGASQRILQSLVTNESVRRGGGAAPDYKRAIGVTRDGVQGTEIFVPKLEITRSVQRATVTIEYLKTLRRLTGRVNNDTFYTFPEGTLLYLGASGTFTVGEGWSFTHKFAYEPNETLINICDGLTVSAKAGWDYLWVAYSEEVEANQVAPLPLAAYVEEVYPYADFTLLQIG